MDAARIAEVCHEANRAYCAALGDTSQQPWVLAPPWQRESAIKGVKAHMAKPGMLPSESHEAWYAHKAAEGWKYGPEKSEESKEHPCMVAYYALPVEQRAKDYIFGAIVAALADTQGAGVFTQRSAA